MSNILRLKCSCGEDISYEVELENLKSEFERIGIVPILVSHKDHFITAYIDKYLNVRSVERVVLVKEDESSVVVKTSISKEQIIKKVKEIRERKDPSKEFFSFLSLIIAEIKEPENLFIAGRYIGSYLWNKRREPIIKLGASFKIEIGLLLANEISPIFEKIVKVEPVASEDSTIVIKNTISPQFIIGVAQGILDAIHSYMGKGVNIALEYVMSGETVFLTLKEGEIVE